MKPSALVQGLQILHVQQSCRRATNPGELSSQHLGSPRNSRSINRQLIVVEGPSTCSVVHKLDQVADPGIPDNGQTDRCCPHLPVHFMSTAMGPPTFVDPAHISGMPNRSMVFGKSCCSGRVVGPAEARYLTEQCAPQYGDSGGWKQDPQCISNEAVTERGATEIFAKGRLGSGLAAGGDLTEDRARDFDRTFSVQA